MAKKSKATKKPTRQSLKRKPHSPSLYEQFRSMAEQRLHEGKGALDRAIRNTKDRAINLAQIMILDAEEMLKSMGSKSKPTNKPSKPSKATSKRVRRDPVKLESDAREAFQVVKDRGASGITAAELAAELKKQNVSCGPSITNFVKQYAKEKIKVKGRGPNAIYTA